MAYSLRAFVVIAKDLFKRVWTWEMFELVAWPTYRDTTDNPLNYKILQQKTCDFLLKIFDLLYRKGKRMLSNSLRGPTWNIFFFFSNFQFSSSKISFVCWLMKHLPESENLTFWHCNKLTVRGNVKNSHFFAFRNTSLKVRHRPDCFFLLSWKSFFFWFIKVLHEFFCHTPSNSSSRFINTLLLLCFLFYSHSIFLCFYFSNNKNPHPPPPQFFFIFQWTLNWFPRTWLIFA